MNVETYPLVAATLKASVKYEATGICNDVIALVKENWPSLLYSHDCVEDSVQQFLTGLAPESANSQDILVHPASVIALLRKCNYNEPHRLFPLFYSLSRRTWQFGGRALGHHLAPLMLADIERFVVGVERLRSAHTQCVLTIPNIAPFYTATGLHVCSDRLSTMWTALVVTQLSSPSRAAHEPLEEWRDIMTAIEARHTDYGVCEDCCVAALAAVEEYRNALWMSLPGWFELE